MVPRTLCAAVIVCLALNLSFAQDPMKVESKHYSLAFENEWVQVVNVHYGAHEKSGYHDHPGGVVVILTGGHLRFTDQSGNVKEVFAKPGESRWFPPLKHKVENLGDTTCNAIYIGVKSKGAAEAGAHGQPDAETQKFLATYFSAAKQPATWSSQEPAGP